jgi:hypothetical protein
MHLEETRCFKLKRPNRRTTSCEREKDAGVTCTIHWKRNEMKPSLAPRANAIEDEAWDGDDSCSGKN